MDRERNVLFGVFAVQLKKVAPNQLVEAAAAWTLNPGFSLADRLVAAGSISQGDRTFIYHLVDEAIRANDGDAEATLMNLGGPGLLQQAYQGAIHLDSGGGVTIASNLRYGTGPNNDEIPALQEVPGRYTHVSEQARGGMGRILLVHDRYLGRDIALKELLTDGPAGSDSGPMSPARLSAPHASRFLQEARIAGQLEHPAIIPVYELGYRRDGVLYYTMKLVRGKTLAQAIQDAGSLPERLKLLPHFVDLCQAMAYAHCRGVIHRDIKPQNIMVGEFGETVVLDWGLAKAKGRRDVHGSALGQTLRALNLGEADASDTAYGATIGTPAYMSPEQARGELQLVDERSDLYSLGAVLFELLNGRPPFTGKTACEVVRQVAAFPAIGGPEFDPDVPSELAAICRTAMRARPEDRYPTAAALAEDVQSFQSGALVGAYNYSLLELLRRFARHHRRTFTGLAMGFLLLAIFAGLFDYMLIRSRSGERAQRLALEYALVETQQAHALDREWRERYFTQQSAAYRQEYEDLRALSPDPAPAVTVTLARILSASEPPELPAFADRLRAELARLLGEMPGTVVRLDSDTPAAGLTLEVTLKEANAITEVTAILNGGTESGLPIRHTLRWDRRLPDAGRDIAYALATWAVRTARIMTSSTS